MKRGRKPEDLTGQRFGRWLVLGEAPRWFNGLRRWRCVCECGTEGEPFQQSLKKGTSISCGCAPRKPHPRRDMQPGDRRGFLELRERHSASEFTCFCHGCGNMKTVTAYQLFESPYNDCGCQPREHKGHPAPNGRDETGKTFGMLTVLERAPQNINRYRAYRCQCVCGKVTVVSGGSLRTGNTKSCGDRSRHTQQK